jgi:hypothetical protein
MADWIKMRSSLLTNPKVIRMARELLKDPDFVDWMCPGFCVTSDESVTKRHVPVVTRIVVGALLPTWSAVNDTAARDGVVRHAASRDIDETAGVPGFGKALMAVEWLKELPDGRGVQFINFEEHNSPQKERSLTAKSPAERQKEYRERKAREAAERDARNAERDAPRDVTVTSQSDDRVEKKRVEKKNKGAKAPSSAALPTWMQALIDLYHKVLPELPGVAVMNAKREQAMRDFRDWVLHSTRPDGSKRATTDDEMLKWAREYFERVRLNDWLMGRTPRPPEHRNWKPSIQWLLSADGMQAVIERTEVPA